ncbi:hypothetical protein BDV37DRAFT_32213 [Aspergillus pseudonomiae]|uniref:Uncharacterized protein n=1 Tax=Aspergillus pseudonomiae TaxID=1506151 RepID=A0A5N7CX84_9EURO|nr:uncharacterized protein BDV37DRAFT_32213 [Aspergillus pseudonomiae]KAE8398387.1 hypothetical protein BDV37DRAFT_32213 [Aspergillus pseudonomiae]
MAVINQKTTPPVPPAHHAPTQQPVNPALYPAVYQGLPAGLYHPSAYPGAYPFAHSAPRQASYPTPHPGPHSAAPQASHPAGHPVIHPAGHPGGHPGVHHGGHQVGHHGGQQEGYSGASRATHTATPRSVDPAKVAEAMARLNVNTERAASGNRQKVSDSSSGKEPTAAKVADSRPYFYIGYTFFKKDATPGHKPTWGQVEKSQMHLTQAELIGMVQKRAKKLPGVQQYQSLSKAKRTHVDQLINELKKEDSLLEWTCAYVKEEERQMKGKNSKRGDYETVSMDVVIMGKPITSSRPKVAQVEFDLPNKSKERVEPKAENPVVIDESRPLDTAIENVHQWTRSNMGHAQQPPMVQVHNVPRQLNPEFTQQAPPPPPPPPQPQVQQAGGRPLVNHGNLPQGVPAHFSFGVHPQAAMPHVVRAAPEKDPAIDVLKEQARGMASAGAHPHMPQVARAVPENCPTVEVLKEHVRGVPVGAHQRPQVAMPHTARAVPENGPAIEVLKEHVRGAPNAGVQHAGINNVYSPAGVPVTHNNTRRESSYPYESRSFENVTQGGSVKPPNLAEPEIELAPDSSSIGDDDSEIFDFEDLSSVTDDSEHEGETRKEAQPWRGSLFRRHSSTSRRPGPSRYRSHYRKQPSGASDNRHGRTKYPSDYVDVIPADSRDSDKQLWRVHSREVARQTRDRPKIIHAPVSSEDLDAPEFDERYRGGRARNDIRTRILDDREARIERREKQLDYRTRMLDVLDERLDDALRRRMSLRDAGPYYSRQHYENY